MAWDGKELWIDHDMPSVIDEWILEDSGKGGEIPVWHRFTAFCKERGIVLPPGLNNDGYHKSTCLWTGGGFVMPEKRPIPFNEFPNMIHHASPGPERANIRSVTPMGFAYAVFESNHGSRDHDDEQEHDN